jgi:hypothetical protein
MGATSETGNQSEAIPKQRPTARQADHAADTREEALDRRANEVDGREAAAEARDRELDDRETTVRAAIDAADRRDVAAGLRDRAARVRDETAELRDLVAQDHEAAGQFNHAGADREAAALDRRVAGAQRHFSAVDRDDAAGDRALLREITVRKQRVVWLVRLVFDDGSTRYYNRLDSDGSEDFTTNRDDARRYESRSAAVPDGRFLTRRYRAIARFDVEEF